MRGLAYLAAAETDLEHNASDPEKAQQHALRVGLYTPIVKGWLTELSQELTYLGTQVHGGMGYVEETGSAQFYRDARIMTIYEGTTGIQGLDLVGRKTLGDGGVALQGLLDEMQATVEDMAAVDGLGEMADALRAAVDQGVQARAWLLEKGSQDRNDAGGASVNFMMLMGYLCGGWVMGKSAIKATQLLAAGGGDEAFLKTKQVTTRFYFEHLLPRTAAYLATILAGSESMMALDAEQF
jgi:hypothetical protein